MTPRRSGSSRVLIGLVFGSALLLAACGGGNDARASRAPLPRAVRSQPRLQFSAERTDYWMQLNASLDSHFGDEPLWRFPQGTATVDNPVWIEGRLVALLAAKLVGFGSDGTAAWTIALPVTSSDAERGNRLMAVAGGRLVVLLPGTKTARLVTVDATDGTWTETDLGRYIYPTGYYYDDDTEIPEITVTQGGKLVITSRVHEGAGDVSTERYELIEIDPVSAKITEVIDAPRFASGRDPGFEVSPNGMLLWTAAGALRVEFDPMRASTADPTPWFTFHGVWAMDGGFVEFHAGPPSRVVSWNAEGSERSNLAVGDGCFDATAITSDRLLVLCSEGDMVEVGVQGGKVSQPERTRPVAIRALYAGLAGAAVTSDGTVVAVEYTDPSSVAHLQLYRVDADGIDAVDSPVTTLALDSEYQLMFADSALYLANGSTVTAYPYDGEAALWTIESGGSGQCGCWTLLDGGLFDLGTKSLYR